MPSAQYDIDDDAGEYLPDRNELLSSTTWNLRAFVEGSLWISEGSLESSWIDDVPRCLQCHCCPAQFCEEHGCCGDNLMANPNTLAFEFGIQKDLAEITFALHPDTGVPYADVTFLAANATARIPRKDFLFHATRKLYLHTPFCIIDPDVVEIVVHDGWFPVEEHPDRTCAECNDSD